MDLSFWRRALQIAAIFLALQVPALRSLAKYFPEPHLSVPIFLVLAFCGTFLAMRPPKWLAEFMQKPWPAVLLVTAFTLVTLFVYPYADALKEHGAGSDADDALILSAQALIRLENPYALSTYLGNPPAPGSGWAFLAIPFSFPGTYWLFFPSTLALALWRLRLSGFDWTTINRFTILMASSLCVWELAAIGSDYLPFVMLTLIAFELLQRPALKSRHVAGLAILVGALSTFRIVFAFLPLLMGFSLVASYPRRALGVAAGGFAVCAVWQLAFYLLNQDAYPPLQLLQEKTGVAFSPEKLILGAVAVVAAGVLMLIKWREWRPVSLLALGLLTPWAVVASADLARHGNLKDWAGASYLVFSLPFVLLSLLQKENLHRQAPKTLCAG